MPGRLDIERKEYPFVSIGKFWNTEPGLEEKRKVSKFITSDINKIVIRGEFPRGFGRDIRWLRDNRRRYNESNFIKTSKRTIRFTTQFRLLPRQFIR